MNSSAFTFLPPDRLTTHFHKPTQPARNRRKKEISPGLYTKDPTTGEAIFTRDLETNGMVAPKSGHHFPIGARERIAKLTDPGSFAETSPAVRSTDPLAFVDTTPYRARIRRYETESGLLEAVVTGTAKIHGIPVSLAVMDFRFCGGAMGSATGEKITRAIELALEQKIPCIIFSASGGARMQEGVLSLMQMAKTSAALGRLAAAKLPYLCVLTHPTSGGVTASFATLADVIIAEPKAFIGFAGPVVIKATTKQTLPPGFQSAEFLFAHGLIDQIVTRPAMRDRLRDLLLALHVRRNKPLPAVPFSK